MKPSAYRYPIRRLSAPTVREDPPGLPGNGEEGRDRSFAEFLRYMETVESEPVSTLARQLIADGITLPPPESFTEKSVGDQLWKVIHGMARRRHFLYSTDHLSDLELYRFLWEITLNDPTHELDAGMGDCACHIDLTGDGSDESIWLWHRYYADEADRCAWAEQFPGDPIPERIDPPYHRDRMLPKRFPDPPGRSTDHDVPF